METLTGASHEALRRWRIGQNYPRAKYHAALEALFGQPVHVLMQPATPSGGPRPAAVPSKDHRQPTAKRTHDAY